MPISRYVIAIAMALLNPVLACASALPKKDYPSKPIRLIVPFAPGGGTDILARLLGQKLTEAFRQPVVVDNRAGGAGTIGAETAVRATPDGYTMILMSSSYATNAALLKLPYDPVTDILPIVLIGETPFLIALYPAFPIKSISELIAFAKSRPGALNYGSGGVGTITHLATELFDIMAGIKMTHVPYKGGGPALNDVIGGQIQLIFGIAPAIIPQVRGNRLRAIAITSNRRSARVPDVPTVAEAGVAGYEVVVWFGVWGPKGLEKNIVMRWNGEVRKTIRQPDMTERLAAEGLDIVDGPPELFQGIVKRDIAKWARVVKEANVKIVQ